MKRLIALVALPFLAGAAPLPSLTGCLPPDVRTVAIVMPGSILAKPRFDKGVAMLRAAGYRVKVAPRLSFKAQAPVEDRVADPKGRIVFLERSIRLPSAIREELDELVAGGYFTNCAGVVFGDITPGDAEGGRLSDAANCAA